MCRLPGGDRGKMSRRDERLDVVQKVARLLCHCCDAKRALARTSLHQNTILVKLMKVHLEQC